MTPLFAVAVCLAVLYLLGRLCEHHINAITAATDLDEGMDTWAAIWEAAYLEDELERWASMPTREHA